MFRVSTARSSRRRLAVLATACVALTGAGPAFAAPDYPPKIGYTPADFGKPAVTPSLVEIVRPERTIVRDSDPALPIVMSAVALLLGLGLALQGVMRGHGLRMRAH